MSTHTFASLIEECRSSVNEIMPWDLIVILNANPALIILDIREPDEYTAMHIKNSIHIPRGLLEAACEFGFEETNPVIAKSRNEKIIIVCRSGNRSLLAARTMQLLGYKNVISLQTGLRGWNDYELPLISSDNQEVDMDYADDFFTAKLRNDQMIS